MTGIVVTASHNPADYNGMKLVERGARPVSSDSGLREIADNASVPVLSMQCDVYHPCQILADYLTIREKFGDPRRTRSRR